MADSQQPEICGRPHLANAHHDGDLSLSPDGYRALLAHRVFVGDEVLLDVSFPAARDRLASLIRGDSLGSASAWAYGEGTTSLARSGSPGSAPGLPRLVQVHAKELTAGGDPSRVALRWEAEGPGGGLFPTLDADITLAPAGEQAATLTLAGVYRPPPGIAGPGLDRAVVLRCATAMIQAFLGHVIEAIAATGDPETEAADPETP